MTEREILKRFIDVFENERANAPDTYTAMAASVIDLRQCVNDAKTVLATTTEPEPEHPAVEAYRKWMRELPIHTGPAERFLAGWKHGLAWAAEQIYFKHESGGSGETFLRDYAAATPTQLP